MKTLLPVRRKQTSQTRANLSAHHFRNSLGLAFALLPASAGAAWASGQNGGQHLPSAGGFLHPSTTNWAQTSSYPTHHGAGASPLFHAPQGGSTTDPNSANRFFFSHTASSLIHSHSVVTFKTDTLGANGLDLSSKQANYQLTGLGDAQTLTIMVGGKSEVVNLQTKLTGAELIAAGQVLSGGQQTIKINASGAATGGTFTLNGQSLQQIDGAVGNLSGLSIPRNVHVIDTLTDLHLSADLVNHGQIIVASGGSAANIQALDIINTAGASITSDGKGNVNLIAEHSLYNAGLISAGNNVNVSAPNITNTGIIKASSGDANFTSAGALVFTGAGGTVNATQGNINFLAQGGGNINVGGGDYYSRQLNAKTVDGTVNIDAGDLTGQVNIDACAAHVNAVTANLNLGTMNVSGDPTYFNQGNITISGAFAPTNGNDLAIVAKGNIVSNGGSLDTSAGNGSGGDLTLIAGANFSTSPFSNGAGPDSTTTLTITQSAGPGHGSATGGLIDLTGANGGKAPIASISTAGGGIIGSGGNVNMYAFAGSGSKSGSIALPKSLTISTSAGGLGNSGGIVLIAGATKGTAISAGDFDTSKASLTPGAVVLQAQTLQVPTPMQIKNGTVMSGSITGTIVNNNANIQVGTINTGGGTAFVSTAGSLSFNNIYAQGAGGGSASTVPGVSGKSAGLVFLAAGGDITGKNIFAFGGGGGGGSTNGIDGTAGGAGGSGGTVNLTTLGGSIKISGQVNVSGGGGGGGGGAGYVAGAGIAGAGGAGGTSGDATLIAVKNVNVLGGIFAADGATGGAGGAATITSAGAGGGGGGSYGGGGGGGAANTNFIVFDGAGGGGGGGGIFGGGGGAGAQGNTLTVGTGGFGGGFIPGAGGNTAIAANVGISGTKFAGGNGGGANIGSGQGLGGTLGFGGTAGVPLSTGTGIDGTNVIVNHAITGGTLTIATQSGDVGSAKAAQTTLVADFQASTIMLGNNKTNYFVNNLAGINVIKLQTFGNLSLSASGDITISGNSTELNLTLSTNPGSNGSVFINAQVGSNATTIKADGSGNIQGNAAGKLITSKAVLSSVSGSIGTAGIPLFVGFQNVDVSANTDGFVYLKALNNVNLLKSSGNGDFTLTAPGIVTVNGTVTSLDNVLITGNNGIVVNADMSGQGAGGVALITTGNGNITEKKGLVVTSPTLEFDIDAGAVGSQKSPFVTKADTVFVVGNVVDFFSTNAFITDTSTTPIKVQALNNAGAILTISSPSSNINAIGCDWSHVSINNTGKTGDITLSGLTGNGGGVTLSTIGGNINELAASLIRAFAVTITTKSGNVGQPTALAFDPADSPIIELNAGAKTSVVNLQSTGSLQLFTCTAKALTVQDKSTFIDGVVKVDTLSVTDSGGAQTTQNKGGTVIATTSASFQNLAGGIDLLSDVISPTVTVGATGGNITYSGKIGTGKNAVNMGATGTITANNNSAFISATDLIFIGAGLGSASTPLSFNATGLRLITGGNAALDISGAKSTTFKSPSNIGGSLVLVSKGALTLDAVGQIIATGNVIMDATTITVPTGTSITSNASRIQLTTTAKSVTAYDIEGTLKATVSISLRSAAKSDVTIGVTSNTAKIDAPSVSIDASHITNAGTIVTPTVSLGFNNPSGDLTITNSGSIGQSQTFSATASGKITITNTGTFSQFAAGSTCQDFTLACPGVLTIPTNTITVSPTGANTGGSIKIQADSIVYPAGLLSLNAAASNAAAGDGGKIQFLLSGKQNILADGANMKFSVDASTMGGNGGSMFLSSGKGTILADITAGGLSFSKNGANANGASLSFIAGGLLQINGNIDLSGNGAGTSGGLLAESLSKTPFVVDKNTPLTATSNGVHGDITSGNLIIATISTVTLANGSTLTSKGGLLQINATKVINNGDIGGGFSPGTIFLVNPTGDLSVSGTGTWATPLIETFSSGGNLTVASSVPIHGTQINLLAKKTVNIGTNNITAQPFFGAGSIAILGSNIVYANSATTPLTLQAQSSLGGGTVLVNLSGKNALSIDNAANALNILVSPTGGAPTSGCSITVLNGGDLTVHTSGLTTNINAIATLDSAVQLLAGGNLLVTGGWNNNITGDGGTLTLTSGGTKAFVVGNPTVNGIATASALSTGFIGVGNNKGDVTIGGTDFITAKSLVIVVAGKNINGPAAAEAINVTDPTGLAALSTNGGSIGVFAKSGNTPFQLSAANITVTAGKGNVDISDNFGAAVGVNTSSAKTFILQTAKALDVNGPITASAVTLSTAQQAIVLASSVGDGTGNVSLTAGTVTAGPIFQSAGTINAKTLTLSGTSATNLQTNASVLTANMTGNLLLTNHSAGAFTIGPVTGSNVTITTNGAIVENGTSSGTTSFTLNSGGAITINGSVTASTVSLNSANGGLISESKSGSIKSASTVFTSDSGNVDTSKGKLDTNTITIGTIGSVTLNDTSTSGNVLLNSIVVPAKSLTFIGSSGSNSNLFLNNIASVGSVSVVWNGGVLTTANNSQITTTNGNITLQNLNNSGMSLGSASVIHAGATDKKLGNVNLFVGPTPAKLIAGSLPANVFAHFSGKGQIFYGAPTANAVVKALNMASNFYALDRTIAINGPANSIVLQSNVTITADPPLPAGTVISSQPLVATPAYLPLAPVPAHNVTKIELPGGWNTVPAISNTGTVNSLIQLQQAPSSQIVPAASLYSIPGGLQSPIAPALMPSREGRAARVHDLGNDALLIAADKEQSFESKHGGVTIRARSLVLVISTERALTIFNLDDCKRGSVVAHVNGSDIVLEPGRHLTVTQSKFGSFSRVNPAGFVAHRRMTGEDCGELKLYKSEFHLPSIIAGLPQLREFIRSSDPAKRAAAQHMLKTAAILDSINQDNKAGFELYKEDTLTAMR